MMRAPRPKAKSQREQMRRIIAGQIRDFVHSHPEAITPRGRKFIVGSLTKRILGDVMCLETEQVMARAPKG